MKNCNANWGTYSCGRPEGHAGRHACHVMGGVGKWDGPYASHMEVFTVRLNSLTIDAKKVR